MDLALEYLARYLSDYTYLGLFLILSVGAFGFPIPEEIVLVAAGLFVHQGMTELLPTLGACAAGQVIGDLMLYAVGKRYGTGALNGLIRRVVPPERLEAVMDRIRKRGLWVVFFGRYLTGVRPAVFLGAGAARIPTARFLVVDGSSALVSLLVWVLLGRAFSGWIEIALHKVRSAEEVILAGAGGILLVLVAERGLVRLGRLREGSAPVRITNQVRIPVLVVSAVFAVLVARQHHLARRARFVREAEVGSLHELKDMGLLIECLPELSPAEAPVELVVVASRELLVAALAKAEYLPGSAGNEGLLFERPPDISLVRGGGNGSSGIALWRSTFIYRSRAVWFGQFTGNETSLDRTELTRSLTRSHYTLRTSVGPRVRPRDKQRVLVAVLREPEIGPHRRPEIRPR